MRGNDSGRLLDQQQLRGKEGRGRNALRGECGGERGLLPGSAAGGGSGEPPWTRGLGEIARNDAERSISGSADRERSGGGREARGEAEPREDAQPAKAGEEELGNPRRRLRRTHPAHERLERAAI